MPEPRSRVVKRPPYAVTAVDNALRIVLLLMETGPMRLSEVADHLGVAPSSAHRLLTTLAFRGFVEQGPDRRYRMGPVLAPEGVSIDPLSEVLRPHVIELQHRSGHSATALARSGPWMRVLATAVAPGPKRVSDRTGSMLPAHRASAGKALLAGVSKAEVRSLYTDRHARLGGYALTAPELNRLFEELAVVRRSGVGINEGGTEVGMNGVGVAIPPEPPRRPWLGLAVVVGDDDAPVVRDPAVHALLHRVAGEAATDLRARGLDESAVDIRKMPRVPRH